jgi:hypothetical protein
MNLLSELLLAGHCSRYGDTAGHLLLGQGLGAGEPLLEPLNGGGVALIVGGEMRPAEITNASRHVEFTANVDFHTTLLQWQFDCVGLPDPSPCSGQALGTRHVNA